MSVNNLIVGFVEMFSVSKKIFDVLSDIILSINMDTEINTLVA